MKDKLLIVLSVFLSFLLILNIASALETNQQMDYVVVTDNPSSFL